MIVGLAPNAAAQPATLGGEFQVNSYTTSNQNAPDVSTNANGAFVVVWESNESSGTDDSSRSIQGQIWAPDGSPTLSQFQVNTLTTGLQTNPALAIHSSAGIMAVWDSQVSSGSDGSSLSIQGKILFLTGDFQINTYTPNSQQSPDIAVSPGGEFMVVWESYGSYGSDSSSSSIHGRLFASNGSPLTGDFQVNNYTPGSQLRPGISVGPGGVFVVVWDGDGSGGSDNSAASIHGRRFASDGTALGSEFQINTFTTSWQEAPDVSVGRNAEFVVVWQSEGSSGSDNSGRSIQGRRYASDGAALGGDFQVNTSTITSQTLPAVSVSPGGEFLVVWQSPSTGGNDNSFAHIQGRRYASDGAALGDDFQVNTYTTSEQRSAHASVGPGGEFVVVWQSNGSSGTDSSVYSIQGQRYAALPLFSDGFESGSTSAWSATLP